MRILFGAIPDSLINIINMKAKKTIKTQPVKANVEGTKPMAMKRSTKMVPRQQQSAIPAKPKTSISASYAREGDIKTTGKILKNVVTKKPIMTGLINVKKKKTGKEMLGSAMKQLSQRDRYSKAMSGATKKGGSNGVGVGY